MNTADMYIFGVERADGYVHVTGCLTAVVVAGSAVPEVVDVGAVLEFGEGGAAVGGFVKCAENAAVRFQHIHDVGVGGRHAHSFVVVGGGAEAADLGKRGAAVGRAIHVSSGKIDRVRVAGFELHIVAGGAACAGNGAPGSAAVGGSVQAVGFGHGVHRVGIGGVVLDAAHAPAAADVAGSVPGDAAVGGSENASRGAAPEVMVVVPGRNFEGIHVHGGIIVGEVYPCIAAV